MYLLARQPSISTATATVFLSWTMNLVRRWRFASRVTGGWRVRFDTWATPEAAGRLVERVDSARAARGE